VKSAGPIKAGARFCGRNELVEGHADPLDLSPDNATRNRRAVCLKVKAETLGDILRIRDFQRGSRASLVVTAQSGSRDAAVSCRRRRT
jgi:hypothetical protein